MAGQPNRIAVLGAGTVGREVVITLLTDWTADYDLTGIAVRDLAKAEAGGLPAALLTDAPAHLVADGPDVIVELMGGEEPARTLIAAALGAGIPVVTANKYVVARHGAELEAIARRTETPFRFEAAVMGGTPILRLLAEDLAGTRTSGRSAGSSTARRTTSSPRWRPGGLDLRGGPRRTPRRRAMPRRTRPPTSRAATRRTSS